MWNNFIKWAKNLFHRHAYECYEGYGQTKYGIGTYKYFICECGKTTGEIFEFKLDEAYYGQKEDGYFQ